MKLKIRSWLFLFFFLFSAVATIFSNLYFFTTISFKMQKVNKQMYIDSVNLVTSTIDSYYKRYAIDFIDIANSDEFKVICHSDILPVGDSPFVSKVRGKMSGDFCFLDLKYPDKTKNTWYTLKQVNNSVDVNLDIDAFLHSAPFLQMQESKEMKPIAGMLLPFYGYMLDKCLYFFCPIFENNEISGVMIDIEKPDFVKRLYDNNTSLKKGTIYITDQFDTIIHYNHPSSDDYYEYDNESENYILEENDVLYDPAEGMGYSEYLLLNTDKLILKDLETVKLIDMYRNGDRLEPAVGTVEYKGKKYFAVYQKAASSGMNVYYFYPLKLMTSPLGHTPVLEFCVIFFILICLSFLIASLCGRVYKNHFDLIRTMEKEAFNGNFATNLKDKVPVTELVQVSQIFHNTIKKSSEQQNYNFENINDEAGKENDTKLVSVLYLKLESGSEDYENRNLVFEQFDKIMKHYSCIPICSCANMYMAICGIQVNISDFAEKLLKAALACIKFTEEHTDLKCAVGISTGKVTISEKLNNIWGKTVEEAFDLMLISGAMEATICENTFKKVSGRFKCTPIGCKSYQVKGIADVQD